MLLGSYLYGSFWVLFLLLCLLLLATPFLCPYAGPARSIPLLYMQHLLHSRFLSLSIVLKNRALHNLSLQKHFDFTLS